MANQLLLSKTFLKVTQKKALLLLQSLLGTIVDVTSMLGEEYDATSFSGEGINPFRLAVAAVPLVISFMARFQIEDMDEDQEKAYFLFTNLAILNAEIMFVGLFGTANYFARLANYFLPAQVVILPAVLARFHQKEKQWLVPLCILGYLGYFYYENNIIRPFATSYTHMSLWDYLSTLF